MKKILICLEESDIKKIKDYSQKEFGVVNVSLALRTLIKKLKIKREKK